THSRYVYARVCAHLMDAMEDDLELEEISLASIPSLQGYHIGHIDLFGNIKTTITVEDLKGKYEYGDEVDLKINAVQKKAVYKDNLFTGTPGELVIYPGSSGAKDNPYLEIGIWTQFIKKDYFTAANSFQNPLLGSQVIIHGVS